MPPKSPPPWIVPTRSDVLDDLRDALRAGADTGDLVADLTLEKGEEMRQLYDYGNGDGLFLLPIAGQTHVWWLGHDPWFNIWWGPVTEWLDHLAGHADADFDTIVRPRAQAIRAEHATDPELEAFLRDLPAGARVYDQRNQLLGVELEEMPLDPDENGEVQIQGRLIAWLPIAPPTPPAARPLAELLDEPRDDTPPRAPKPWWKLW